jgi:methionine salvage enolase-phosphatase E1
MRTTITISDTCVKELLHYTHTKKTTEAVNIAIVEWLRQRKINELKKLQGQLAIDDNLEELRTKEKMKQRKWHE